MAESMNGNPPQPPERVGAEDAVSQMRREIHAQVSQGVDRDTSQAAAENRERSRNETPSERRADLKVSREPEEIMKAVRGKRLETPTSGSTPVEASLALGATGAVLRAAVEQTALVAGVVSVSRDAIAIATGRAEGADALAKLSARYVVEREAVDLKKIASAAGVKEKAKEAGRAALRLVKNVNWLAHAPERWVTGRLTETRLEENSSVHKLLELLNNNLPSPTEVYEMPADEVRRRINEMLNIHAGRFGPDAGSKTDILIDSFGFLTRAKTLNGYTDRSLEAFSNIAGGAKDLAQANYEKVRDALYEQTLSNMVLLRRLAPSSAQSRQNYEERIARISQYKTGGWEVGLKVAAIEATTFVWSTAKAFMGYKAAEALIEHLFGSAEVAAVVGADEGAQAPPVEGAVEQSDLIRPEEPDLDIKSAPFQDTQMPPAVQGAGDMSVGQLETEDVLSDGMGDALGLEEPQGVQNVFEQFAAEGKPDWRVGADLGDHLEANIDMGELAQTWQHGDVTVMRDGAFENFFGHWYSEGGALDGAAAETMAEHLRDSLILDQQNPALMGKLLGRIANAQSARGLLASLNSMAPDEALKAAYYAYSQGIVPGSPEIRGALVDFIKQNS